MWNPVTEQFGAMAAIYGTVVTSIIAMAIAVPSALGIAIFLTELCPYALRRPIGIAIELLAGIPSIIYGIWGLFVFAPFLQEHVQPGLISVFANVPVLSELFAGPPYGIGVLTAGVILAIMVLPIVSAISRDVFETVPAVLKEAAYGVGCTTWEVVRSGRDPLYARGHYRRRSAGPRPGSRRWPGPGPTSGRVADRVRGAGWETALRVAPVRRPARTPGSARPSCAAGLLVTGLTTCALVAETGPPPTAGQRTGTTVQVSADQVLGEFDNPAWYQNQSGPNSPLSPRDLDLVDALDVAGCPGSGCCRAGYYRPGTTGTTSTSPAARAPARHGTRPGHPLRQRLMVNSVMRARHPNS